eukprot:TRINITY_DN64467_c0_g1_i1.p1 TRINITY_DN64467_c0_g1~~TRINITY_DN64467_c0_g1_i1.p1  ORF type:complete len:689 (-),score=122.04 TRINITY_DN64467_c0_g1_i1:263-2182(-)
MTTGRARLASDSLFPLRLGQSNSLPTLRDRLGPSANLSLDPFVYMMKRPLTPTRSQSTTLHRSLTGRIMHEAPRLMPPKLLGQDFSRIHKRLTPDNMSLLELTEGAHVEHRLRRIPRVEHRGIMVKQLEHLLDFLKRRSSSSSGELLGWRDESNGQKLYYYTINFYEINQWIVRPLTREVDCSYVEAVAFSETSQIPSWFASHWWGQPLAGFVPSMKKHALLRSPDNCGVTSPYWICEFAHNQNTFDGSELSNDLREASFHKAMAICKGIVVMMDETLAPCAFGRIWCCFELVLALRSSVDFSFDIAAVDIEGGNHVITESLTEEENGMEELWEANPCRKSGWNTKTQREERFPSECIRAALEVDISQASASDDFDTRRILNLIAGLPAVPKRENEVKEQKVQAAAASIHAEMERRIRGRFAKICMRQAVQQRGNSSWSVLPFCKALRENPDKESLSYNFACCYRMEDLDLTNIGSCFPSVGPVRSITVDLRSCYQLTSLDGLLEKLKDVDGLQEVNLKCGKCLGLRSADGLASVGRQLSLMKNLSKLSLDFTGCTGLYEFDPLMEQLMSIKNMKTLSVLSPEGINLAKKEKPVAKPKPKPKVKPKAKQWSSITAQAWASAKPKAKSRAKKDDDDTLDE